MVVHTCIGNLRLFSPIPQTVVVPWLSVCTAWALRGHCVHIVHAEARILTEEYLSPVY